MKKNIFLLFASTFLLTTSALTTSAKANTTSFACATVDGVPTTVVQTPNGNVPVIKWVSSYFANSGWTPERRCNEVSSNFQKYHSEGTLKYLTTGIKNGQNVVCITQKDKGSCQNLLFTLKANGNPGETLKRLMDIRRGASKNPLFETSKVYINMDEYLESKLTETSNSNFTSKVNSSQPVIENLEATKESNLW